MIKKVPILVAALLLITSCGKSDTTTDKQSQSNNDQLLARISELESENNQLKKELDQYKGVSEEATPDESTPTADQQAEQATSSNNKLIGGEEKGAGTINLSTPGGEGPQVTLIVDPKTTMSSIGFLAENVEVDGNEPTTVYIDGQENSILQLSNESTHQGTLMLESEQLKPGTHNVEVIQEINGEQTFYRLLTYEVK